MTSHEHDIIIEKLDEAIALIRKLDETVQCMTLDLKEAADELEAKNKQWPHDVDRIEHTSKGWDSF